MAVRLSAPTTKGVVVRYDTQDQTATAASGDYPAQSGVLHFAPGETVRYITVTLNGDTTVEPNEQFLIALRYSSNATISWAFGGVAIVNDD